jgi:hypothetical protein
VKTVFDIGMYDGTDTAYYLESGYRVVAVEAGKVQIHTSSSSAGCMLYLYGASGTTYLYIHLNNDLTARNDNKGACVEDAAFAVPNDARVSAGEQVAWNGDSGDANGNPHLHFEVHPNGGADVNPFKHLMRATRPLFAAKPGAPFSLGLRGKLVAAGGGAVTLEVERVRHYPGGRWLEIDPRTLELTLPPEAMVAPSIGEVTGPSLRVLKAPVPVAAYTLKAKTTPDAIVGVAGTLQLSRVSLVP